MACPKCSDKGQVPSPPKTRRFSEKPPTFGGLSYCTCPAGTRLQRKHASKRKCEALVQALLAEAPGSLTARQLKHDLPEYELVDGQDGTITARLGMGRGAWEVQIIPADQPGKYRVQGDYKSDTVTASVGLDQVVDADQVVAVIRSGEQDAGREADKDLDGHETQLEAGQLFNDEDGRPLVLLVGIARGGSTLFYWSPEDLGGTGELYYFGEDPAEPSDGMGIAEPWASASKLDTEPKPTGKEYEGVTPDYGPLSDD